MDARQGFSLGGVYRPDARVGVRAAQQLADQHAALGVVIAKGRGAGDELSPVHPPKILAYYSELPLTGHAHLEPSFALAAAFNTARTGRS